MVVGKYYLKEKEAKNKSKKDTFSQLFYERADAARAI
jgi:hypothetical protein